MSGPSIFDPIGGVDGRDFLLNGGWEKFEVSWDKAEKNRRDVRHTCRHKHLEEVINPWKTERRHDAFWLKSKQKLFTQLFLLSQIYICNQNFLKLISLKVFVHTDVLLCVRKYQL